MGTGAGVGDLHPALVRAFLDRVREPGCTLTDVEVLQECGVLTRSRPPLPTRFGLLALGIRPERFLSASRTRPSTRGPAAVLAALAGAGDVTSHELSERTGLALATVRRHLSGLVADGLVTATAPSTSHHRTYRRSAGHAA